MTNNKYTFLNGINSPSDLREFDRENTAILAEEIRDYLIQNVNECGGHLASNLGVVELTLALHRVFNTPEDKIVWDVGHQSYVHKLVTGRREEFNSLRTPGGLSGFTKRSESEYDPFGAGHSSTSISAALGIAEAEKLKGGDAYTVAVVGDGSFTGGMIYEALNNCDRTEGLKLIIVLNENEMSISKNIGSIAKTISKLRTSPKYFKTKEATRSFLAKIPFVGKPLVSFIVRCKKTIKNILYGFRPSTIKANPVLYVTIIGFAVFNISIQTFMPYLIIYYEVALALDNYVLIMAPAIIIAGAVTAVYGRYYDKVGFFGAIIPSMASLMLGYLILAIFTNVVLVFIGSLLMMTGYLTGMAVFGAMIRDYTPSGKAGALQGLRIVGQVLIPGIIGPAIGAAVLSNAEVMIGSDGTQAFIPNANIFIAALVVGVVTLALVFVIRFVVSKKKQTT